MIWHIMFWIGHLAATVNTVLLVWVVILLLSQRWRAVESNQEQRDDATMWQSQIRKMLDKSKT